MLTIDGTSRIDKLHITVSVADGPVLHCPTLDKNFTVDHITVKFDDGILVHVRATGPVRNKDGSNHARLIGEATLIGNAFGREAVRADSLPEWTSGLVSLIAADPTYVEYIGERAEGWML